MTRDRKDPEKRPPETEIAREREQEKENVVKFYIYKKITYQANTTVPNLFLPPFPSPTPS
jgi:hypothetical protein